MKATDLLVGEVEGREVWTQSLARTACQEMSFGRQGI